MTASKITSRLGLNCMPFDHFDFIAGLYNRVSQFSAPVELLDLLALSPNQLFLDAGGGTGRVTEELRMMVRDGIIADPSLGMLRHAMDKGLATVCAPAEELPFASLSFDRIIMVDALHHVLDQMETIVELWRVLAPGGRIVIVEPDIHKFSVKLVALGEKLLMMRSHFISAENIAALFVNFNSTVRIKMNGSNVWVYAEK